MFKKVPERSGTKGHGTSNTKSLMTPPIVACMVRRAAGVLPNYQNSYKEAFSRILMLRIGFSASGIPPGIPRGPLRSPEYPQGSQEDPSGAPWEFKNVKYKKKKSKVAKSQKCRKYGFLATRPRGTVITSVWEALGILAPLGIQDFVVFSNEKMYEIQASPRGPWAPPRAP